MNDDIFMQRCLQLAALGAGYTAPNPMVGAVLVKDEKIIGEGWHQQYGQAHAEVNCIADAMRRAAPGEEGYIQQSTLYVSLEPCAHVGKTPACTDLIIRHLIPRVVIGCTDPFEKVNGLGIQRLQEAGVQVKTGVLENESRELNKRFFTFHTKMRPYIILKWAQTANGFMASPAQPATEETQRLYISNEYTNRLVHKWRSEEAAILVGTQTALADNPRLTTRLWSGPSPIRLVMDRDLQLPASLHVFDGSVTTIVFNRNKHSDEVDWQSLLSASTKTALLYWQLNDEEKLPLQVVEALYKLNIQSLLVEGGSRVLQSFIDENLWDEARIITNEKLVIKDGLAAPLLQNAIKTGEQSISGDTITTYRRE